MTTYFTSDQHFGHRNIITYSKRPFASVEEMTEEIIKRHNDVVKTSDTVIHLGDFALDERLVEPTLKRLNGRHHLIAGNHDKCHACHSRHLKMAKKYVEWGFAYVRQHGMERLYGKGVGGGVDCVDVLLSHLPYRGDTVTEARPKGEERYPEFRLADGGKWLLHGHVHELWRIRDRMINVGVDQWDFTPVAGETLAELIRSEESR